MKKLILLTAIVCVVIAGHASANPTPGYEANMSWNRGDAGTTWQEWDFLTNSNPAAPENSDNAYGNPTANLYEVQVPGDPAVSFGWHDEYLGRTGVWSGDAVYADIIIPNTDLTGGSKVVWMEVGFAAVTIEGGTPAIEAYIADGLSGSFEYELLAPVAYAPAGVNWYTMTVGWRITPNPQSEMITIGFAGTGGYIDYVSVDTRCAVPVPGAIILGGIGVGLVGWIRRRRMA